MMDADDVGHGFLPFRFRQRSRERRVLAELASEVEELKQSTDSRS